MYNNGNSSKNVTGASVVDGTLENADFADNGLSGDKIDGGIISNFQSTGIDDRLASGKSIYTNGTYTGIGTSTPARRLEVVNTSSSLIAQFRSGGTQSYVCFANTGGASADQVRVGTNGTSLVLATNYAERMRIDSSGNMIVTSGEYIQTKDVTESAFGGTSTNDGVLIGGSNAGIPNAVLAQRGAGTNMYVTKPSGYTSGSLLSFRIGGTGTVGGIDTNGSSTSYNTSSDYRLKENVAPMTGSIDRLKELKPSKFNFTSTPDTTVDGFLAHEAQSVVPEAVQGTKDGMKTEEYEATPAVEAVLDAEGNVTTEAVEAVMATREVEDYQGIDQSKLVPLLVSALQEAIARIETLESI
jgi:hypothetical protein